MDINNERTHVQLETNARPTEGSRKTVQLSQIIAFRGQILHLVDGCLHIVVRVRRVVHTAYVRDSQSDGLKYVGIYVR